MTGDNSENCTGVVSKLCRKTVSGKKIVTGFLLIRLKGTKLKKAITLCIKVTGKKQEEIRNSIEQGDKQISKLSILASVIKRFEKYYHSFYRLL